MRILVTGGAGFLGSNLVCRLVNNGHEVIVIDPGWTGDASTLRLLGVSRPGRVRYIADSTRGALSTNALRGWLPHRIFHLGAMASPPDYKGAPIESLRTGSLGTHAVADYAYRTGARLVFTSTSEVYGDPAVSPQPETYRGNVSTTGPRSMYDEARRYAEAYLAAEARWRGLDVRIARVFNTYGPGMRIDDGRMIPAFAKACFDGYPVPVHGDGSQTRTLCFVSDLVDGLLLLAASDATERLFTDDGAPNPVNLGGEGEVSVLAVADGLRRAYERETGAVAPPVQFVSQPCTQDPRRRQPDLTRAREVLGYEPSVSDDEGLARTIAWWAKFYPGKQQ